MKRTLYWLTHDLRINDNLALHAASKSEHLLCVYVVDKQWFQTNNYQSKALGIKRWHFLQSCLNDFNQALLALGQQLYIVYGDTLSTLAKLCDNYQISDLITTKLPGTYEQRLIKSLSDLKPELAINTVEQYTLYEQAALPFELEQLPISYSKFRKAMTGLKPPTLAPVITSLPPLFDTMPSPTVFRPQWLPNSGYQEVKHGCYFSGGEQYGLRQLSHYFSTSAAPSYKQLRNNLDGWQNSSKLSAWLSYGCISARQVFHAIAKFEQQYGKNSSTECLYLELLWREYFQWLHFSVGAKIYHFKGLAKTAPLTSFYNERFSKWCLGNTPYPLVNACMNELRLTGYLSNRGRQIVASCLVNELSVDWRYGAAWFQEHLVDYDAAVNWGNWQYIAGVGVDPRGGRHFNLEKQTTLYDPDGLYQEKWTKNTSARMVALDSVDASDWPITAEIHHDS